MITPGYVGIDISKQFLDLFDDSLGTAERCPNTPQAIAGLVARWHTRDLFVLFEATGAYDRNLRQALAAAGIRFSAVNPARARDFARATGRLAKTDSLDARMLAAMARALQPQPQAPHLPERETLARLNRRRDQLVDCRKRERTRREAETDTDLLVDLDLHIAFLDARIAAVEARIRALLNTPALAAPLRLLRSIPGVGPVAAAVLLARMPELGTTTPKAAAALAGLAPFNVDSGTFRGKRSIRGGRNRVRQALYMAAVTASRCHPRFKNAYQALRAAGKPPKLALVAIARRIVVTANALLRDNVTFQT